MEAGGIGWGMGGGFQQSYDDSENMVRGTITQSQIESNMHINYMILNQ